MKEPEELTDLSPMPFSKYSNKPMQDVPVEYLHWLWTKAGFNTKVNNNPVAKYIGANLHVLKEENKDLIWRS